MNSPSGVPRTLTVICADWPVVAAGFGSPTADPTVVLRANRVVATNHTARAAGVQVGLRRRDAQRRCPELHIVAHDPARDARCFEPVAAALATLTPQVEITDPGVCSLATRGPSRYFGGDDALAARALASAVEALTPKDADLAGEVRVGLADGPLVAHLAAIRAETGQPLVVPPDGSAAFVAPIPLRLLGPYVPDPDILATLSQLGLTTLRDVADLPSTAVLGRFGPAGIWVHRLARGLDPRALHPEPIPPDMSITADLDPPAERSDAVAFVARTAAGDLVSRLTGRGLTCTQVIVMLHTEHHEEHERRWRLDGPGSNPTGEERPLTAAITDRVRWQVDGWLSAPAEARPSAGVTRLTLTAGEVAPAHGRQLGFWGGEHGANTRVVRAVARLEALVGVDAVRAVEARGGRYPGDEAGLVPTAIVDVSVARDVRLPGLDDVDPPWPGRLPSPSPSLVLDPPQQIDVLDARGHSVEIDGRGEMLNPPTEIRLDTSGGPGTPIVSWAGPWPVDERWWDPDERRRYALLRVVTDDGTAMLTSRSQQMWWLTAVYC